LQIVLTVFASELHNFFDGVDAALNDRRDAEVEMLKYMADII